MKKRSKAETERFYRELLAEQRRSGMSIRAFAQERGVPAGTISAWGYELRKRDAAAATRKRKSKKAARPSFVPVSVVSAVMASERTESPTRAGCGYEVELGAGRVLRLPADFDDARVAALVRAVASC